jgi:hypothetical protein
MFPT